MLTLDLFPQRLHLDIDARIRDDGLDPWYFFVEREFNLVSIIEALATATHSVTSGLRARNAWYQATLANVEDARRRGDYSAIPNDTISNQLLDVALDQVGELIASFWDEVIQGDLEGTLQAHSPHIITTVHDEPSVHASTMDTSSVINPQGPPERLTPTVTTLSPNTPSPNTAADHASRPPLSFHSDSTFGTSRESVIRRQGPTSVIFSLPNSPVDSTPSRAPTTSQQDTGRAIAPPTTGIHGPPQRQARRRWYSSFRLGSGRHNTGVPDIAISSPARASEEQVAQMGVVAREALADLEEIRQGDGSREVKERAGAELMKSMQHFLRAYLIPTARRLGSRSPSPSPTATPIVAASSTRPDENAPWSARPGTPAPHGPLPHISPSDTSGMFRLDAPRQTDQPESPRLLQTPLSSTRRPGQSNDTSFPTVHQVEGLHDLLTVVDVQAVEDPNCWGDLFIKLIGLCTYSVVDQASQDLWQRPPDTQEDLSTPGASTSSAAAVRTYISCTNPRHHELGLPCSLPTPIDIQIQLAQLLRNLETSQSTRISQLMSIVAQVFLGNTQTSGLTTQAQATGGSTTPASSSDRKGKDRARED